MAEPAPSITCPICGRTSWHPKDVEYCWCGNCHGATSEPPPPGMRWVRFHARAEGPLFGRLVPEPLPERYELVAEAREFELVGDEYREVQR